MKTYVRELLLIIVLLFFLFLFFQPFQDTNTNIKLGSPPSMRVASSTSPGLPVRLIIPKISIDTSIQQVGVAPNGAMDVPTNVIDVGWFDLGPRPGEKGSAVIDGHFDRKNGGPGIFFNLYKLKKGDKLYIQDNKGKIITFIVQGSSIYNPGYANNVFTSSNGVHLNLITCDGVWDGAKKSYSKRLVVFADMIR